MAGNWASEDEMDLFWRKVSTFTKGDERVLLDHEDPQIQQMITVLKQESAARSADDLKQLEQHVLGMPGVADYFNSIGVTGRYIHELIELLQYRFYDEGDEIL